MGAPLGAKKGDLLTGLVAVQAVQVELLLHHPASVAQVAQHPGRPPWFKEGRLIAAF